MRKYNADPMMMRATPAAGNAAPAPAAGPTAPPGRGEPPTLFTMPPAPPRPTYGGHPPHAPRSDTSRAAAESVAAESDTVAAFVLAFVKSRGDYGATQPEAGVALARHRGLPDEHGESRITAGARVRELELRGYLAKTPHRRATRANRTAKVYTWTGKPGDGSDDNQRG